MSDDNDLSPVPLTPKALDAWGKATFRSAEPGEMVDLEDDPEFRAEMQAIAAATPEPSAAAQPSEREGPHANGHPACTCPDEPGPEDPDWDGTLTFDPACPWHGGAAPEGGGASGENEQVRALRAQAALIRRIAQGEGYDMSPGEPWRVSADLYDAAADALTSLRADRDRLERELEEARRERDAAVESEASDER